MAVVSVIGLVVLLAGGGVVGLLLLFFLIRAIKGSRSGLGGAHPPFLPGSTANSSGDPTTWAPATMVGTDTPPTPDPGSWLESGSSASEGSGWGGDGGSSSSGGGSTGDAGGGGGGGGGSD